MTATSLAYRPEGFRREYVTEIERLREAVERLEEADAVGVDIEMGQRVERKPGGIQEWKHSLALVQIAGESLSVVIDPLRCSDLSPLRSLLTGSVRKVFLGGGQDAALLELAGIPARTIADVGEAAYAVFGRREDGMAALSKRIFNLSLDKTVRRADWLVRPLNPVLVAYAHQDAELTLLIYRWFEVHYPEVLSLHKRLELEPPVPSILPAWLRDALLRGTSDPRVLLVEHNLELPRDSDGIADDISVAMRLYPNAPRRINRLVRIAGELELKQLLPSILPLSDSLSSLLRASAARAVGKLAPPEVAKPVLDRLATDSIEDVRKAAQSAARDLKSGKKDKATDRVLEDEEEAPGLDGDALAALQQLRQRLDSEPG